MLLSDYGKLPVLFARGGRRLLVDGGVYGYYFQDMTDFAHLHVHSDFSLADAAVSTMSLADKAEELGMEYLALTDHGNMFGAMEFLAACEETVNEKKEHSKREKAVKPILGCEVYVSPGSRLEKKGTESDNRYFHLVLLAMNKEGYHNLIKLCSFAYTEGFYYRPRIDEELLVKYHGGLIALSACVSGEIPQLIRAGKTDGALEKARHYRDLFGVDEKGNPCFYLEIQDHGIPAEILRSSVSQKDINKALSEIAKKTGIPLVATNDVHYLNKEDSVAHDILLCIGTGKVRTEEKRKKYYGEEFYFKSGDEMAALFPEYPEAVSNTIRIAERCTADFLKPNKKTGNYEYKFPKVAVKELADYLPEFQIPSGFENAGSYLEQLVQAGLEKRYPAEKSSGGKAWDDIQKRAKYELGVIIQMNFTGYFLIVADFINWAKENNIPVGPGRGSGAGSIVAYALRITNIDPLKYNLLFERFLNPERISMPDFDVDFANEGREDVIKYVTQKYGWEHVGQIITFGTLGAKAVIKDVARTLGISIPESDMLTKLIPKDPKITLKKALAGEPKLKELSEDPRYTELFSLAVKLEGLNRHSSIHAAGVVIGKSSLHNFVPLYFDRKTGGTATQYSMNYLEACGLIKMDFLGLKTLDVIKRAEELIRLRGGQYASFSVENEPEDDEATFKMLCEGKSFEVFQFESEGMQSILKRAKPGSIEDLIALNSLYRPGPMDNIGKFIDSKNGVQEISYPDPSLEGILKETYGVIVYQEQVMQVAQIIAGYSMGQADLLRRAMGKKKKEIIDKEKIPFLEGAVKQGYSASRAGEIFDILVPFAGYGFNKSHAAAYSVIAYHTAYLKANFPAEFMAASLTNEIHSADKDKLSECINEAGKMGLEIDPPDINRSQKLFSVIDGRVVYGLLGIKGLGDGPSDEIVNSRSIGPYKDFLDFLNRVDIKTVGKSVIEKLIQTGAFDLLSGGLSRETLLGNLERAVEYVQNIKDEKKFGQASLFGDTGEKTYQELKFEEFPSISRQDKLKLEKELIGFYFSGHPLDEYRELWQKAVKVDLAHPERFPGASCILIGIVKTVKTIMSKGGKMAFAALEDYNGEIELTFFPGIWRKCEERIEAGKTAILKGKIEYQKDRDKRSFTVDECLDPDDAERAVKEEEAQGRKWDKYKNVYKYADSLDLKLLDLSPSAVRESGNYIALGILKSLRIHHDKKGGEMAFGTLADSRGEIDLVFFSRTWEKVKAIAAVDEMAALNGKIEAVQDKESSNSKQSFMVTSFQDINKLVRQAAKAAEAAAGDASGIDEADADSDASVREEEAAPPPKAVPGENPEDYKAPLDASSKYYEFHIRLKPDVCKNEEALYPLAGCVKSNPGACPVFIHVPSAGGETVILAADQITPSVSIDDFVRCAVVAEAWVA